VKDCCNQDVRVFNPSGAGEQACNLDQVIHIRHSARTFPALLAVALGGKLERTK
jgi:hypothetical protein